VSDPRDGAIYACTPSVLDLVICGAESGLDRDARAMDVDWVRSLRDQVKGAPETAFFYKQDADRARRCRRRSSTGGCGSRCRACRR